MRDFNIDIRQSTPESHQLDEFCSLFSLTNIIKSDQIPLSPNSFQKTNVIETGISDRHKDIRTFFKSHFERLKRKIVYYRNYKTFNGTKNCGLSLGTDDPNKIYDFLTNTFI